MNGPSNAGPVVFLVHGWHLGSRFWNPFVALAKRDPDFRGFEFSCFTYSLRPYGRQSMDDLAKAIRSDLIRFEGREIHLVGIGIGALLVRSAYLNLIRDPTAGLPGSPIVRRLVLLAAPNLGLSAHQRPIVLYVRRLVAGRLIKDALAGSRFVVNLRLGWLSARSSGLLRADVFQIRAAADHNVTEEDTWDLQIPADRSHVVLGGYEELARPASVDDIRYLVLKDCLLDRSPDPGAGVDREKLVDNQVRAVLFLVPGMRDWGFSWRSQITRLVREKYPGVIVVDAQFGWFSTWDFLTRRQQRVRQWIDVYSRQVARYAPTARMVAIAHSYGTYAIAQALKDHPDVHLDGVFFAGSPLPQGFEWHDIERRKQMSSFCNVWATRDFWTGLMSQGLGSLFSDLGASGFLGFDLPPSPSRQLGIKGGHGAFVHHLERALDFLLDGSHIEESDPERNRLVLELGTRAGVVLMAVALLAFAGLMFLSWWLSGWITPLPIIGPRPHDRLAVAIVLAGIASYALLEYI
jgi:pimeloyl-ACP methyl ester carboxylesterase